MVSTIFICRSLDLSILHNCHSHHHNYIIITIIIITRSGIFSHLDHTWATDSPLARCPQWAFRAPAVYMNVFNIRGASLSGTNGHHLCLTIHMVCSCSSSFASPGNAGTPCSISTKMQPAPLFRHKKLSGWDDLNRLDWTDNHRLTICPEQLSSGWSLVGHQGGDTTVSPPLMRRCGWEQSWSGPDLQP